MKIKFVAISVLFGLVLACGKKGKQEEFKAEMYEPTELALLMKQMLKDYELAKDQLVSGKVPGMKVDYSAKILTAKATNPDEINDTYHAMGKVFVQQADRYASDTTESLDSLIVQHNLTIQSCVNCHQYFCGGPVPSIRKLLVP